MLKAAVWIEFPPRVCMYVCECMREMHTHFKIWMPGMVAEESEGK